METDDFDLPYWEEKLFKSMLEEAYKKYTSQDLPAEKLMIDVLKANSIYLGNLKIREGIPELEEAAHLYDDILDEVCVIASSRKPLTTLEDGKFHAALVDLMVLQGSEKGKAIQAVADWLCFSFDKIKNDTQYCRVKIHGGKIHKDAKGTESGLYLMYHKRIVSLVKERASKGHHFPKDDKQAYNAFLAVHKAAVAMGK